ncbi:class I SAM-dependent methyltransferase [Nocardia yamanashiensis]|uniref:class I SAM-dependent methyltransferase n=1 Tax=Nocardia yamanashiensis TaxID=209247 RepID=UPI000A52C642|nr:class I SAM-dependent methyltransferase [Nocardia yamanashiensis]
MTSLPEGSARAVDGVRASAYDSIAEGYDAENESGLLHLYYNRPAILELAGEVAGRRILDVGCGSGIVLGELRDRGAVMTGMDSSGGMLELARRRLGPEVDLRFGDLGEPLPFSDGAFDDVVASLVLHYLEDWGPALGELRRVLVPGGRMIVSVEHPFANFLGQRLEGKETNYFETRNRVDEWTMGGQTARLSFWDRPLHAMTDAFAEAGFRIGVISEPGALPGAREVFPELFDERTGTRFLCFLFFVLYSE